MGEDIGEGGSSTIDVFRQRASLKRRIRETEIKLRYGLEETHDYPTWQVAWFALSLSQLYRSIALSYFSGQVISLQDCDLQVESEQQLVSAFECLATGENRPLLAFNDNKNDIEIRVSALKKGLRDLDTFEDPSLLNSMAELYQDMANGIFSMGVGHDFIEVPEAQAMSRLEQDILRTIRQFLEAFDGDKLLTILLTLKQYCDDSPQELHVDNILVYKKIFLQTFDFIPLAQLNIIAGKLYQQHCINLINALWLCHLNPEPLLSQLEDRTLDIEDTKRLQAFHQFIEALFLSLETVRRLKGGEPFQDKLLHGQYLPEEIQLTLEEQHKLAIIDCVRALKLASKPIIDREVCPQIIDEMRQSFKYRFDPEQFIDALMSLDKELLSHRQSGFNPSSVEMFTDYFRAYYANASSQDLLIFYRHFRGEDLNYLMSVIEALSQGKCFEWLALPEGSEVSDFFREIYFKINVLLQLVREELASRSIATSSYRYQSERNNLSVRKRNRACIKRIIDLYFPLRSHLNQNSELESLFEELGELQFQDETV